MNERADRKKWDQLKNEALEIVSESGLSGVHQNALRTGINQIFEPFEGEQWNGSCLGELSNALPEETDSVLKDTAGEIRSHIMGVAANQAMIEGKKERQKYPSVGVIKEMPEDERRQCLCGAAANTTYWKWKLGSDTVPNFDAHFELVKQEADLPGTPMHTLLYCGALNRTTEQQEADAALIDDIWDSEDDTFAGFKQACAYVTRKHACMLQALEQINLQSLDREQVITLFFGLIQEVVTPLTMRSLSEAKNSSVSQQTRSHMVGAIVFSVLRDVAMQYNGADFELLKNENRSLLSSTNYQGVGTTDTYDGDDSEMRQAKNVLRNEMPRIQGYTNQSGQRLRQIHLPGREALEAAAASVALLPDTEESFPMDEISGYIVGYENPTGSKPVQLFSGPLEGQDANHLVVGVGKMPLHVECDATNTWKPRLSSEPVMAADSKNPSLALILQKMRTHVRNGQQLAGHIMRTCRMPRTDVVVLDLRAHGGTILTLIKKEHATMVHEQLRAPPITTVHTAMTEQLGYNATEWDTYDGVPLLPEEEDYPNDYVELLDGQPERALAQNYLATASVVLDCAAGKSTTFDAEFGRVSKKFSKQPRGRVRGDGKRNKKETLTQVGDIAQKAVQVIEEYGKTVEQETTVPAALTEIAGLLLEHVWTKGVLAKQKSREVQELFLVCSMATCKVLTALRPTDERQKSIQAAAVYAVLRDVINENSHSKKSEVAKLPDMKQIPNTMKNEQSGKGVFLGALGCGMLVEKGQHARRAEREATVMQAIGSHVQDINPAFRRSGVRYEDFSREPVPIRFVQRRIESGGTNDTLVDTTPEDANYVARMNPPSGYGHMCSAGSALLTAMNEEASVRVSQAGVRTAVHAPQLVPNARRQTEGHTHVRQHAPRFYAHALRNLRIACPSVLENTELCRQLVFVEEGDQLHVLFPDSCANTIDPLIEAGLNAPGVTNKIVDPAGGVTAHGWASVTLPGIAQLQKQRFTHSTMAGSFNAAEQPRTADDTAASSGAGSGSGGEDVVIESQRFMAVTDVLLQLGISADVVWDSGGMANVTGNVSEIQRDHYVVLGLSDRTLIVSDEPERTYVLPRTFTDPSTELSNKINSQWLRENGRPVYWNNPQQFERSLQQAITMPLNAVLTSDYGSVEKLIEVEGDVYRERIQALVEAANKTRASEEMPLFDPETISARAIMSVKSGEGDSFRGSTVLRHMAQSAGFEDPTYAQMRNVFEEVRSQLFPVLEE